MEVLVSPPPATVTLLTDVDVDPTVAFTVIAMGGVEDPAAMTALVVQVTICPAALQLQPEPVALT